MAPKKKAEKDSPSLEEQRKAFFHEFPHFLAEHHGDLISIWMCTALGEHRGQSSEAAMEQLLAPSLHRYGTGAIEHYLASLNAKNDNASFTSEKS